MVGCHLDLAEDARELPARLHRREHRRSGEERFAEGRHESEGLVLERLWHPDTGCYVSRDPLH